MTPASTSSSTSLFAAFENALDEESSRVLLAVQTPLEDLVTIQLEEAMTTASDTTLQPVLTLHFSPLETESTTTTSGRVWRWLLHRNPLIDAPRITAALDAVALIHDHARRLQLHPRLYKDFLLLLLLSRVMWRHDAQANQSSDGILQWCRHQQPANSSLTQLRILLDFGVHAQALTGSRMDALYKFLTEPPRRQPPAFSKRLSREHKRNKLAKMYLGLSIAGSVSTKWLRRLRELLDRVAPLYNRYYGIDMLDLRQCALSLTQQCVVADIVKRNRVYQIQDLKLNDAIRDTMMRQGSASPESLWMLDALNTDSKSSLYTRRTTSLSSTPSSSSSLPYGSVQSVVSAHRSLGGVQQFAAIYSALRYGCAFEELSLASTVGALNPHERDLCWAWIAFGIFYPRSSPRFATRFLLRTIHLWASDIDDAGVEAFANALENPVAALRRSCCTSIDGKLPDAAPMTRTVDAVVLCKVTPQATIYFEPDARSAPISRGDQHPSELEMLFSSRWEEDLDHMNWVCVVVPDIGVGWIQADDVVSVDRDTTAFTASTLANDYNNKEATITDFELILTDVSFKYAMTDAVRKFIQTISRQLRALTVRNSGELPLGTLLYHCLPHLTHLSLEGCHLRGESFRDLLAYLQGIFGHKLVSLNLNKTDLGDGDVKELARLIRAPTAVTALYDLHLYKVNITHAALQSLYYALRTNVMLAVLELEDPRAEDIRKCRERVRLDAESQVEISRQSVLSGAQKRAFLSVLAHPKSPVHSVLGDFVDLSMMATTIFDYAVRPVRRRICWTPSTPPSLLEQ
ncbi:hypothetical protein FI667_g4446, partial [Globisporangium splendens]